MIKVDLRFKNYPFVGRSVPVSECTPTELLELAITKCVVSHLEDIKPGDNCGKLQVTISGGFVKIKKEGWCQEIIQAVEKCDILKVLSLPVQID